MSSQIIQWGVVITACCVAAIIDVRCRRIPNQLTVPLFLTGVAWWVAARGMGGLADALAGMAVAGAPFFLLWLTGGGGAGDAKMMFAIGAWLGPVDGFLATLAVALAGGILSLAYATAHRRSLIALANALWMTFTLPFVLLGPGRFSDRQKLVPASGDVPLKTPYSVAMLAGTCAAAGWIWICTAG
jgi:prepilin peptidase CpaA